MNEVCANRKKIDWFYLSSIRTAIATYVPCLGSLLRVPPKDSQSFSSYPSSRRATVTSQSSEISGPQKGKRRLSSFSDSESVRETLPIHPFLIAK